MAPAESKTEIIPSAPTFVLNDDWEIYSERLEHFFNAHPAIEIGRKAAILLTSVSADVYKIIKNALFPGKPGEKSFKELCDVCAKQFSPIVSSFAERNRFYEARQREGESVCEWITRVKSLAINCGFGEHLTHALRDKFVCGLLKGPILEKVYELKVTASLDECVSAAQQRELTLREKSAMAEPCYVLSNRSRAQSPNGNGVMFRLCGVRP